MKILDVAKTALKTATTFANHNSPEILTATAILGLVTTVYLVNKAAPKAKELLEEKDYPETDDIRERGEIVIDAAKTVAPVYIPAAISTALTAVSIIGSNRISHKRLLALDTAYMLLSNRATQFEQEAREALGAKKTDKIWNDIYKKDMEGDEDLRDERINVPEGKNLYKETLTGQKFTATPSGIEMAIAKANQEMNKKNGWLTKNHWLNCLRTYAEADLELVADGDDQGWDCEHVTDFVCTVQYESLPNGNPIGYLHYLDTPEPLYHNWY